MRTAVLRLRTAGEHTVAKQAYQAAQALGEAGESARHRKRYA
ncbi:MAG: hypothetical protein ACHQ4H_13015 [Ktedonobacterales bacterium]